jgi:hypothetical protein
MRVRQNKDVEEQVIEVTSGNTQLAIDNLHQEERDETQSPISNL